MPIRMRVFVSLVSSVGMAVLGLVLVVSGPFAVSVFRPSWLLLAGILIIGELMPVAVLRADDRSDSVTVSSAFALALVLSAPLAVALVAQAVALLADDARRRPPPAKVIFNLAQYTLSLTAARLTFAALSGQPALLGDASRGMFSRGDVLPAVAAGAAFFLLNHALVTIVISLQTGRPVLPHVVDVYRMVLPTSGILNSLAPVIVVCQQYSPWLVLLLLLPVAAVHKCADLAGQRAYQAAHDSLTGLGNRLHFRTRTEQILARQVPGGGWAVFLLDLDHFKEVNDTLGHQVGDELLTAAAARLTSVLRGEDFVCRLGGDEFAALAAVDSAADAELLARRLVAVLDEPIVIDGVRLATGASVGVALAPEHGTDVDSLLQHADVALYVAKRSRGTSAVYEPATDSHGRARLALTGDLRQAIEDRDLFCVYQPQCRPLTGETIGIEALVRWTHPVHGLLPPDEFISIAENTGLIGPLTDLVLEESLRNLARWRSSGHPELTVSVNLSCRTLTDLDLPDRLAGLLLRNGLAGDALQLEVTESTILADLHRAGRIIARLRELGIGISVDDFGTGYSSLAALSRLDVDEIKIDRSFVSGMLSDPQDAIIVRSTIDLGHNLGLRVVAEGVCSEEVRQMLLPMGCDVLQGYLIGVPMTSQLLGQWLASSPYLVSLADSVDPIALRIA